MRVHKITNCYIAIKFLEDQNIKGITIAAEDFVDASEKNLKYLLGFCWILLKRFQNVPKRDKSGSNVGEETQFEQNLLSWIREMVDGSGSNVEVDGFSSLQDGRAILALLEKYDKSIVTTQTLNYDNPAETINLALSLAEKHLGIPADILDIDELIAGEASEKGLVLYSTLLFNSFQNKLSTSSKDSLIAQIKDLEKELKEHKWKTEKKHLLQRLEELKESYTSFKEAIEGENNDLEDRNKEHQVEVEELQEQKKALRKKLKELREKREEVQTEFDEASQKRLDMEKMVSDNQMKTGRLLANLSEDITTHVEDMNAWKILLKQKTSYVAETIQQDTKAEFEELGYDESYTEFEKKLVAENELLAAMLSDQMAMLGEMKKAAAGFMRNNVSGSRKTRQVRAPPSTDDKNSTKKKRDRKSQQITTVSGSTDKRKKKRKSLMN